ncbi:hypothetical protein TNCV_2345201 [Trichonephila clavipes]|nr:hypothetical protein TNCV_2345201 [Trichonephila clavipes]
METNDCSVLQSTQIVKQGRSQKIGVGLRRHWTLEDWKLVMWWYESRYTLFCTDGRHRICKEPYEVMNPPCLTCTAQISGESITIWGMLC